MIGPRLALTALLLTAAAQPQAQAQPAASDRATAFALQEVAPGVFVHFGQPLPLDAPGHDDIANIGFIVGRKCVAVIDTGGSTRIGRALRMAIKARTAQPICYVVNTHVHVDHVLGNFAFRSDHPTFVGHAALPHALSQSRAYFMTQYASDLDQPAAAEQIIGPDQLVRDTLELDLGGRQLSLRAWPVAHTDCDLTVIDTKSSTLWAGDLLFRERLPALDGDAGGWLAVIEDLKRIRVARVIPGHGPLSTELAASLLPESRYLRALLDGVHAAIDAGESIQDAIEHVAASERPQWLLWDSTHPRNVVRLYQQLEWQ